MTAVALRSTKTMGALDKTNFLATSIFDTVAARYSVPLTPFPSQHEAIQELAPLPRSGWYAEPGCGKTLMSTIVALYKQILEPSLVTLVLMPPILLNSWTRWLNSVQGVGRVVCYRGTPAERAKLRLDDAQFICMSYQIFKRDAERLARELSGRRKLAIADEATALKNVGSENYRTFRDFFAGEDIMLLTGTPLSSPADAYAYVKLVAPLIYRSQREFENIHVEAVDFFGKVTKWRNLDLLQRNLLTHSVRMLKEEVLSDLKQPLYNPIRYELDPAHQRLYKQLMEEQLLVLESGQKIDATSESRLYNAAQQIVVNLEHFSGKPGARSRALEVVDQVIEELGIADMSGRKLIVFAMYRMTNRLLMEELGKYGAVACFSEVSASQQSANIDRFMTDPKCQILIAHPQSAGFGLNCQEVCSDVLFLETPTIPMLFHQGVARVYRQGQKRTPNIRIAIAEDTIQPHLHKRLLDNDALVNRVQIGYQDLREALYARN